MRLRVRYFAALREALGAGETLVLDANTPTVGQVRDVLVARGGAWAEVLGRGRTVRAALDQELCDEATPVADNAELAFFPPVTGG